MDIGGVLDSPLDQGEGDQLFTQPGHTEADRDLQNSRNCNHTKTTITRNNQRLRHGRDLDQALTGSCLIAMPSALCIVQPYFFRRRADSIDVFARTTDPETGALGCCVSSRQDLLL